MWEKGRDVSTENTDWAFVILVIQWFILLPEDSVRDSIICIAVQHSSLGLLCVFKETGVPLLHMKVDMCLWTGFSCLGSL